MSDKQEPGFKLGDQVDPKRLEKEAKPKKGKQVHLPFKELS